MFLKSWTLTGTRFGLCGIAFPSWGVGCCDFGLWALKSARWAVLIRSTRFSMCSSSRDGVVACRCCCVKANVETRSTDSVQVRPSSPKTTALASGGGKDIVRITAASGVPGFNMVSGRFHPTAGGDSLISFRSSPHNSALLARSNRFLSTWR